MKPQKSDDLEKRARELEERENSLNLRENLLEREKALEKRQKVFSDAETKLDVLNKQIKAKEDILAARGIELDQQSNTHAETIEKLEAQENKAKKAITVQEEILANLKLKESSLDFTLRSKKSELSKIQDQVKETKDYLKEQERISQDTISQWNMTLIDFRKEADNIQLEKNKLSADIIRMGQEKIAMSAELKTIQDRIESLDSTYNQKVETYKSKLRDLDTQVNDKKNELDNIINSMEMRRVEIETREKSLKLKEGNVQRRDRELDQKERRLKGAYGMADLDFNGV